MKALYIVLIFIVPFSLFGQKESTETAIKSYGFPKYRIGISPTSVLHWYPSIQVSNDYAIHKRVNATLETGYIFEGAPMLTNINNRTLTSGLENRIGVEFALISNRTFLFSTGLSYMHKYILVKGREWVNRGEFLRWQSVSNKFYYNNGYVTLNAHKKLGSKIMLEFGVGIGAGYRISKTNRANFLPRNNEYLPDVYYNLNISYIIFE